MKIFISADIEGIPGIVDRCEGRKKCPDYQEFRELMTEEVVAVCEGAYDAGAKEIYVKDAHGSGRNIFISELPEYVYLIRGKSGHPYGMMQELDNTFDASLMVGYHSPGGSDCHPLAHTFIGPVFSHIKVNGKLASEFLFNSYISALVKVPVAFVSGDEGLCSLVKGLNPNISVLSLSRGIGSSSISRSPKYAFRQIRETVKQSLKKDITKCQIELPDEFEVEIEYKEAAKAYIASFYPGMKKTGVKTVAFTTCDYFEVLRMLLFIRLIR